MYWSDWGDAPAIEKMSMDGLPGTRKQLITTDIVWPNGLSLDLPQNKIYWIDAKLKRMEACDLTGGNRMTIKSTGTILSYFLCDTSMVLKNLNLMT